MSAPRKPSEWYTEGKTDEFCKYDTRHLPNSDLLAADARQDRIEAMAKAAVECPYAKNCECGIADKINALTPADIAYLKHRED